MREAQKVTYEGHKRVHIRGTRGYTGGAQKGIRGAHKGACQEHRRLHMRGTRGYLRGVQKGTHEGHKRVHTKSAAICINIFFTLPLLLC